MASGRSRWQQAGIQMGGLQPGNLGLGRCHLFIRKAYAMRQGAGHATAVSEGMTVERVWGSCQSYPVLQGFIYHGRLVLTGWWIG
jgi:hypothetical protein